MPGYRDHTAAEHLHSRSNVYPTVGPAPAAWVAGVTVTSGAVAGNFGAAWTVIIPAGTIQLPFDIHWFDIESIGANGSYEMLIAKGAPGSETEIGRIRFTRINNNEAVNGCPFLMKIVPATMPISAKIAHSAAGAQDVVISSFYHTY